MIEFLFILSKLLSFEIIILKNCTIMFLILFKFISLLCIFFNSGLFNTIISTSNNLLLLSLIITLYLFPNNLLQKIDKSSILILFTNSALLIFKYFSVLKEYFFVVLSSYNFLSSKKTPFLSKNNFSIVLSISI